MIPKLVILLFSCITCIYTGSLTGGYDYPIPSITPPPQFDEPFIPQQPIPTYLPPQVYPPLNTPGIEIQPPQFDPGDTVVIPAPPSNQYLPPSSQYLPPSVKTGQTVPQIRVLNMSCLEGGFFRSNLQISDSSNLVPILDDRSNTNGCIVRDSAYGFRLDAEGAHRMKECGVKKCDSKLCVTIRMPTVPGLLLPEDQLVTLQCTPQQSVISHVKQVRLGIPKLLQGRSTSRGIAVATGGSQRRFDTQIVLLRKSPGSHDFDQSVQSGSTVHLGEELLLRSVVRDGDGWRYSRMGPVVVRSSSTPRSVTLIDENGCRPSLMRSICPEHPRQVGPLVTSLPIRAFLFQDAVPGDNMLLTVKMVACINPYDCYKGRECQDDIEARNKVKRDTTKASNNTTTNESNITNWESSFEFRVVTDEGENTNKPVDDARRNNGFQAPLTLLVLLSIIGILGAIVCLLIYICHFRKHNY